MPSRLANLNFVDIVLGQDFCDVKMEQPGGALMQCVATEYIDDVAELRRLCLCGSESSPEFTMQHDGMRFRVTTMQQVQGVVWFLSRIDAQIRPLSELAIPRNLVAHYLKPGLQGLLLVSGGFGAGKTTAAATLFAHRITSLGGTGVALEDPAGEVRMAGRHGPGRIIQIPVSRESGGYQAGLQLIRRSRADALLIGEIRDAETAIEAQDIANTDMPVIATIHASSVEETFDKYQAYLRAKHASSAEANARLALSIAGVLHLTKEYATTPTGEYVPRFIARCLILDRNDPKCMGALGKIRDGNFIGLNDDISFQAALHLRDHRRR